MSIKHVQAHQMNKTYNIPGDIINRERLIGLARNLGLSEHCNTYPLKILIRKIQQAQGQAPCYLTEKRFACNANCEWSGSCKKLTAAWLR